jgi:outer membrane protein assembly factor BamB
MFYAPPTVGNGAVYAAGYNGVVYAIDARTGNELWKHNTGSAIAGGVAMGNGTLFVGTSQGLLYALDANATAAEGALREGFEPFQAGDKIWSTPSV